jgi:LMBR1-like membrane protein
MSDPTEGDGGVTPWVVAGVESVLLLLYCTYTTLNYAAKGRTPTYVIVLTVISWYLSFMVIFLIPVDIYTVSS